ncbi:MAG: hypothetical protein PHR45_09400 [Muribaculaceae bacterium]|nr:hypothetical protein [Muribaculaceae bacterium]
MLKLKILILAFLASFLLMPLKAPAQKNEVSGYAQFGKNTISGYYGGFTGFYKRAMTSRIDLIGGFNVSTKSLYGISAEGSYRLPINRANLFFTARVGYNYYTMSTMNEYLFRLAVRWETRYIDVIFGNTFINYASLGSHNFEPVTWSVGFGANLKPRESLWNVGVFIRNHDDFFYENWNINWGLRGYFVLNPKVRFFGEFMIRPAGSMNQLAVKYETALKIGAKYKW